MIGFCSHRVATSGHGGVRMQGRGGRGRQAATLVCGLVSVLLLATTGIAQQTEAEKVATRDYVVAQSFQKKQLYAVAETRWKKFLTMHAKSVRLPAVRLNLAVCQLQLKRYPDAAVTLRQLLKLNPQFKLADRVQYNLGLAMDNIAVGSGKVADFEAAAVEYGRVAERYTKSEFVLPALYYQAECLFSAEKLEGAVTAYNKALAMKLSPKLEPDILYGLGTAQEELEKYAEAGVTYQRFLKTHGKRPEATEITLRLGLCLFRQKKYAESQPLFARAAAVKDFPQADLALLQQGHAIRQQEKLAEAATVFESLPRKFAKSAYIAESLLAAGKCRFGVADYVKAQQALASVVADPKAAEVVEASAWLGRTLVKLKKPADAVVVYDKAIAAFAKSPRLPELVYFRGEALYAQPQKRAEAAASFLDFTGKYAEHELAASALYMSALSHLQIEKPVESLSSAETFLGKAKLAKHELRPEVLYVGGQAYLLGEQPDWAKAEVLFRGLVSGYPKHQHVPAATVRIGFCLYRSEKYDPAVAHLSASIPGLADAMLKAEAGLLLGRSHQSAKRPAEAIAAFRAARAAAPKWDRTDELLYVLGATLKDDGKLVEAAVELTKLQKQFIKSEFLDRALYELGEIARAQQKLDPAVVLFQRVLAEFPKSDVAALAQYGMGAALYEKGEFKQADGALQQLATKFATHAIIGQGRRLRGSCLRELKDFAGAVGELQAYLAGKPAASAEQVAEARFELALCQIGLKQHKPAIDTLNSLLKDQPKFAQKDNLLYELAFTYQATDQAPQALASYRRLVAEVPMSSLVAESWFRIGQAVEKTGDEKQLPEAATAYVAGLKVVKKPSVRQNLLYQLGWVRYRQERYPEAAAQLTILLKDFPEGSQRGEALLLAGECQYLVKNWKEAVVHFEKVVADKNAAERARALYRAGTCHLNLQQWPLAQQRFEILVKEFTKYPQLSSARYGLGLALQKQNQLEQALGVFEQVTKETNTEVAAKARFMIGEIAFSKKQYKVAYESFLVAAFKYPYEEWQAKGYLEAGRCFKELKDNTKARELLATVIKKFPKRPEAKAAAQVLATLPKAKAKAR